MALNIVSRSFNQAVNETVQKRYFVGENDILLNPNLSPIFVMITKLGNRKPTPSPRVEWAEDDFIGVWGQSNDTNLSSVATNILVVDGTLFAVGDLVAIPKADSSSAAEEIVRVTAVSTNTLTITRGIGGAGADTIAATVDLRILGSAHAEGAAYPSVRSTTKAVKISYTQIFRSPVKVTKTIAATAQFGAANERMYQREKALEQLRREFESCILYGRASESLASPSSIRTSMGLKARITTNLTNVSTTLTETVMLNFAEQAFSQDYHGNSKLLAAASKVISALDFFSNGNLLYGPDETVLGVKVRTYRSTHGDFKVVKDFLLEDGPNGGIGWGDEAFAIDVDSMGWHPLVGNGENRDTSLLTDVVKDGTDVYADEYLAEACASVRHEKRHARLYNCSAFS